jgi:cobalt-zinc-cadmium efflux system membrane fusion protein
MRKWWWLGGAVAAVLIITILTAAVPALKTWMESPATSQAALPAQSEAHLDPNDPTVLVYPADLARDTAIRTGLVRRATKARTLDLAGSLATDTDALVPVRSRFPGEVVEIAKVPDRDAADRTVFRDLRSSDHVARGDLLAVVWSKDLGEKKSELTDAYLNLRVDKETLRNLDDLYQKGGISPRSVREAQLKVESDQNAISRIEATLHSWRLSQEEIDEVYKQADQLALANKGQASKRDPESWKHWARVEVRSPIDGTILERNVAIGALVDTSTSLFMIGDLNHLTAWFNVYEEDLPHLQSLPRPIQCKIRLKAEPEASPLDCTIFEIRPVIDPTVHAALVRGRVENPAGRLIAGQFVTASLDLPAAPDLLIIPTAALIEDGYESVILVQPEAKEPRYQLRRVRVVRRTKDIVTVRAAAGATESPLKPGDRVVISGNLEMWAAMKDMQESKGSGK